MLAALAGMALGQTPVGPALTVNTASSRHAISPDIYGVNNYSNNKSLWNTLNLAVPVQRWGGDNTSNYNWLVDASNAGSDNFFIGGTGTLPQNVVPGQQGDSWITFAVSKNAKSVVTVPVTGWVNKYSQTNCSYPKSLYPIQDSFSSTKDFLENSPCGKGTNGVDGDGNTIYLTDVNVARNYLAADPTWMADWYNHLKTKYGNASTVGLIYQIDNEPESWPVIHTDVHPDNPAYDELVNLTYSYGGMAKTIDPTAKVMGPTPCCVWAEWGLNTANIGADGIVSPFPAPYNMPFYQYYLTQMKAYETQYGYRLLDYFDIHFYPEVDGQYPPFASFNIANSTSNDIGSQAARLRTTRTLWDPTYISEDWMGQYFPTTYGTPMLIRNMRSWVNQYYPGTKTSITEYNWGGSSSSGINGALAQADVLGIFGREGLDLATMWGPPSSSSPIAYAFKMYLNYDGSGSRFGDVSVASGSANQNVLSIYAAQRTSDTALTLMVINKSVTLSTPPYTTTGAVDLSTTITIENFTPGSVSAQVWQLLSSNAKSVVHQPNQPLTAVAGATPHALPNYTVTMTFPANSITLLVVPGTHSPGTPGGH